MRRRTLRSLAVAATALGTLFPALASAETVEECHALGVKPPPEKLEACKKAYADALETQPTRQMYNVDPATLPTRLHSAHSKNQGPGAYREFDKSTVRERSSAASYRTLTVSAMVQDVPWLSQLGVQTQTSPNTASAVFTITPTFIAFPPLLSVGSGGVLVPSVLTVPDELTFQAHPTWEARGDVFNTCEEYAWKLYYQHSRFADSARVCGNDMDCIADVAFAGRPPGIAFGDIYTINMTGPTPQKAPAQLKLVSGSPNKNLYFASSPWFLREQDAALATNFKQYEKDETRVRANGGCAFMQPGPYAACAEYFEESVHGRDKLSSIDDLLRKKYFYSVGTSWLTPIMKALGSTELEKFPTEWDFHAAMRTRVPSGTVPEHERRSIEERTAYLEKLIKAYVDTTSLRACRAPDMAQGPNGADLIEGLGPSIIDIIGGGSPDPWVERWAIGSLSSDLVALSGQQTSLISPIGIVDTSGTRIDVPSLVGQNKALLPSGFTSVPAGQFLAVSKSNRTKLAAMPVDVIIEGGKQQTMSLTSTDISLPGTGKIHPTGIVGAMPSGLTKLTAAAACTSYDATTAMKDLSSRGKAIVETARKLQHEIVELLVKEYDRGTEGCLSLASYKCDWSPALLASRFVEQLATEKQTALNTCQAYGGDLTEAKAKGKNRVSVFQQWVAELKEKDEEALREMPSYKNDLNKVVAGEADHDDFYRGDSEWFGGGYNYDAGWSFAPVHALPTAGGSDPPACGVVLDAHAQFQANAAILGPILDQVCVDGVPDEASKMLATATAAYGGGVIIALCDLHNRLKHFFEIDTSVTTAADPATNGTRGTFQGKIIVEGKRVFEPPSISVTTPSVQEGESILFKVDGVVAGPTYETPRASLTIVVVVVPVTFEVFGELHVGAQVNAKVSQTAQCTTSPPSFSVKASLGFTPFAKATALASAAIGVSGLQAGVRGRVVLVDARVPLNGSIAAGVDGLGAFVQPSFDARLATTFLSGGLSAFAEVGYGVLSYTAEKEIFSFDGFHHNLGLWSYQPAPFRVTALNTSNWSKFTANRASGGSL